MATSGACVHHFDLDQPGLNGRTGGVCRKCGAAREWANLPPSLTNYDSFMVAKAAWKASDPYARVHFGAHYETGLAR